MAEMLSVDERDTMLSDVPESTELDAVSEAVNFIITTVSVVAGPAPLPPSPVGKNPMPPSPVAASNVPSTYSTPPTFNVPSVSMGIKLHKLDEKKKVSLSPSVSQGSASADPSTRSPSRRIIQPSVWMKRMEMAYEIPLTSGIFQGDPSKQMSAAANWRAVNSISNQKRPKSASGSNLIDDSDDSSPSSKRARLRELDDDASQQIQINISNAIEEDTLEDEEAESDDDEEENNWIDVVNDEFMENEEEEEEVEEDTVVFDESDHEDLPSPADLSVEEVHVPEVHGVVVDVAAPLVEPFLKSFAINYLDRKISNRNMHRIRRELMDLTEGDYFQLTQWAPLAAGFLSAMLLRNYH